MNTTKAWYNSTSIIGSIISLVSLVAGMLGYNIAETDQVTIAAIITSVGTTIGSITAIYGRVIATEKIK